MKTWRYSRYGFRFSLGVSGKFNFFQQLSVLIRVFRGKWILGSTNNKCRRLLFSLAFVFFPFFFFFPNYAPFNSYLLAFFVFFILRNIRFFHFLIFYSSYHSTTSILRRKFATKISSDVLNFISLLTHGNVVSKYCPNIALCQNRLRWAWPIFKLPHRVENIGVCVRRKKKNLCTSRYANLI